jgi:hypothetical protein
MYPDIAPDICLHLKRGKRGISEYSPLAETPKAGK